MVKVATTKIGGGAMYAKVSDRLKQFRSDNPRALIETTPIPQANGMIMFKARILKDKSEVDSGEATGHALQTKAGLKDFEKLETIAVGRALALLGYGADGEIASSEEMEEFEDFKQTQKEEQILAVQERVDSINDIDELREYYKTIRGMGAEVDAYVMSKVDVLKSKVKSKTK